MPARQPDFTLDKITPQASSGIERVVTTAKKTMVSAGVALNSKDLRAIPAGVVLDIVETKLCAEDKRIRGKLAEGGWISIENTATGFRWVQPWTPPPPTDVR